MFGSRLFLAIFALALLPHAAAAQTKPVKASPAVQQEFSAFIGNFRAAVKANDAARVTAMTKLPFYYEDAQRDAAQFRAKAYPFHFTAKNRACLQTSKPVYDRDGYGNDSYFIFCGHRIFVFTKDAERFQFTDVSEND